VIRLSCSQSYVDRQSLAFASLALCSRVASSAEQVVGSVSVLKGVATAEITRKRRRLERKSPLYLGDTVNTGARSRLVALLLPKTTLKLGAETRVRIDNFIVNAGGEILLDSGALLLDVSRRLPEGFAVRSLFALIAVRGTTFFAGQLDDAFSVFVVKGSVDVIAGGEEVRLRSGEGIDIAAPGGKPGPVKKWGKPKISKAMALVN
jgi:ferric-dicitrate binding protein FerR (iron transport regulator)